MSQKMKYPDVSLETIEAVLDKLGGMEGVSHFLRDKLVISEHTRRWEQRDDGIIYFEVVSDGTSGEKWIELLPGSSIYAKDLLRSPDFKPTNRVTYEIAVLRLKSSFNNENIFTFKIREEGKRRGWRQGKDMSPEVACLIRRKFTREEIKAMGLDWIVCMHETIKDSYGNPCLLGMNLKDLGDDDVCLSISYSDPDSLWNDGGGCAFVSQVSSKD